MPPRFTQVLSPITSTAYAFLIHTAYLQEAGVICCAGSSIVAGVVHGRSGRFGLHRLTLTVARVEGSTWRISYVGHASFLIQTAGLNILLDPVWSKRASPSRFIGPKRVNEPGIAFVDLPSIDVVVLVSHGHYDHLDVRTLADSSGARRARHHASR